MNASAIPWYQSKVLVGLIVSIISGVVSLVGEFGVTWNITEAQLTGGVQALFELISLGAALFSAFARARSPIEPVALTKAGAEEKSGYTPQSHWIVAVLALIFISLTLGACTATRTAYKEATTYCDGDPQTETPYCIENLARVLTENYFAVLKEAADYREQGGDPSVVRRLQAADRAAAPVIDQLDMFVQKYLTLRTAESEADVQKALNDAAIEVGKFINVLRGVKPNG